MRKAFDPQLRLDCPEVADVHLNVNCRHEIIPILRALQHIYDTPDVRDAIFAAIARDVNRTADPSLGRPGMTYREITVLAAARLGCNCDYDQLSDLAQNHRAPRQIMGIGDWDDDGDAKKFDFRRIESSLDLLSPETIQEINAAIATEGHRLAPEAELETFLQYTLQVCDRSSSVRSEGRR